MYFSIWISCWLFFHNIEKNLTGYIWIYQNFKVYLLLPTFARILPKSPSRSKTFQIFDHEPMNYSYFLGDESGLVYDSMGS